MLEWAHGRRKTTIRDAHWLLVGMLDLPRISALSCCLGSADFRKLWPLLPENSLQLEIKLTGPAYFVMEITYDSGRQFKGCLDSFVCGILCLSLRQLRLGQFHDTAQTV